jgi:hypothetical protein
MSLVTIAIRLQIFKSLLGKKVNIMRLTVSRNVISNHSYGCHGVDVMLWLDTLGYVVLTPERITMDYSVEHIINKLRGMR